MKSVAFTSALVVAGAETVNLTYKDCGSSSTHAKITGLTPTSIDVPGKASIVGTGDLDSDQTSAHFSLKVKKGIIPFVSGSGNICEDTTIDLPLGAGSFTVKGLDCPIKAGSVDVEVDLDLLSDVFEDGENSLLSIHIDANADDSGDQVICLDVDASLAAEDGAQEVSSQEEDMTVSAEGGVLAVTWSDCGAVHGVVQDLQPTVIHTGATETLTGSGVSDEEVTSAQFTATLSALGTKLTECSGDATTDIVCQLPMGVGSITVKAVSFPMPKGETKIPVEVSTSSLIPPSLANVDVHIAAVDQNGESAICLDVHTAAKSKLADQSGNCAAAPYGFCCGVGTACDCTQGMTSEGQCDSAAYSFCCMVGTKCDCESPPLPFLTVV